jgi:hypothetical protein
MEPWTILGWVSAVVLTVIVVLFGLVVIRSLLIALFSRSKQVKDNAYRNLRR